MEQEGWELTACVQHLVGSGPGSVPYLLQRGPSEKDEQVAIAYCERILPTLNASQIAEMRATYQNTELYRAGMGALVIAGAVVLFLVIRYISGYKKRQKLRAIIREANTSGAL